MVCFLILFGLLAVAWLQPAAAAPDRLARQVIANTSALTVDLGYAAYTGVYNSSTGLNVWKGLRYAQAPVGPLRWQDPRPPVPVKNAVVTPFLANTFAPACPQSLPRVSGASALFIPFDEDCLFLNVYAPATNLSAAADPTTEKRPVLVWMHGGGYGLGDGKTDMSAFLAATNHSIVGVSIQYRLGAFGFLASSEVRRRGRLNAGLQDQLAALRWVQEHISKFGGDPRRVTLAGESAGAGSVLLHAAAPANNSRLFRNIWAASPWVQTQPVFDDPLVERHYADFAAAVGCGSNATASNVTAGLPPPLTNSNRTTTNSSSIFDCLVSKDSRALQNASNWVSTNPPTPHANWAFIPVTDGVYVMGPPSALLKDGQRVRGVQHALIGNNADEGVLIASTIRTEADLVAWLHGYFTRLSDADIQSILTAYPLEPRYAGANGTTQARFETDGLHAPTANDVSGYAAGMQQRTYNIYAEAAIVCPSYWLGDALAAANRSAYHYQYSAPLAGHGADVSAYWGPAAAGQGPELVQMFRDIIARFVVHDDPTVSVSAPSNGTTGRTLPALSPFITRWRPWQQLPRPQYAGNGTRYRHSLLDLNQTTTGTGAQEVTLTVADADTWEGGRGRRCAFWQRLGARIPE